MRPVAVFDTNILFSGVGWQGKPYECLELAAGTFIDTADTSIVAAFPQNYLMNVQPGNEVELVLDPYPGQLFKAKVHVVIPATGEGQYTTGGNIPRAAQCGKAVAGYCSVGFQCDFLDRSRISHQKGCRGCLPPVSRASQSPARPGRANRQVVRNTNGMRSSPELKSLPQGWFPNRLHYRRSSVGLRNL